MRNYKTAQEQKRSSSLRGGWFMVASTIPKMPWSLSTIVTPNKHGSRGKKIKLVSPHRDGMLSFRTEQRIDHILGLCDFVCNDCWREAMNETV